MRVAIVASVLVTLIAVDAAAARDLLSAAVPKATARVELVSEEIEVPSSFTTRFGRAGYVCSISGLGRSSTCIYRSWDSRQ